MGLMGCGCIVDEAEPHALVDECAYHRAVRERANDLYRRLRETEVILEWIEGIVRGESSGWDESPSFPVVRQVTELVRAHRDCAMALTLERERAKPDDAS